MFKDMRHPRGIRRVRLEADGEDVVRVIAGDVQVISAGLVVLEVEGGELEFGHMFRSLQRETVEFGPGLWKR